MYRRLICLTKSIWTNLQCWEIHCFNLESMAISLPVVLQNAHRRVILLLQRLCWGMKIWDPNPDETTSVSTITGFMAIETKREKNKGSPAANFEHSIILLLWLGIRMWQDYIPIWQSYENIACKWIPCNYAYFMRTHFECNASFCCSTAFCFD